MIKNKILIIEDDSDVVVWIERYLKEFGFIVTAVETVTDALAYINKFEYDIVILDLNLPDFLGYEVLKHIAQNRSQLPVIVASANSEQSAKLHAFHLGASDYMTKPLDLAELEARIRVHTKANQLPDEHFALAYEKNIFKIVGNKIYFKGIFVDFTKTEFDILVPLIKNRNKVLTRERLSESLSSLSKQRTLDYHIRNIRLKIGEDPSKPLYIVTEYGVGYKIVF